MARAQKMRVSLTALAGTVLVTAYAVAAAAIIVVLNPLAAAPGKTLDEIIAETEAARQPLGQEFTIGLLSVGVVLALLALAIAVFGSAFSVRATVLTYLALLAAGAPAYWIASFTPGMSLADTYAISGGDHTPWGAVLFGISAVAALALFVVGVTAIARASERSGSTAGFDGGPRPRTP